MVPRLDINFYHQKILLVKREGGVDVSESEGTSPGYYGLHWLCCEEAQALLGLRVAQRIGVGPGESEQHSGNHASWLQFESYLVFTRLYTN